MSIKKSKYLLLSVILILSLKAIQETLNFIFGWQNWLYIFDVLFIISIFTVIFVLFKYVYSYSEELSDTESFLQIILENMKAGVVVTDSEGNIMFVNDLFANQWRINNFKYPISLKTWASNYELFHIDGTFMQCHETPLAQVLAGKEVANIEYLAKDKDSSPAYLLANGRPLIDKTGKVTGAVMVVNDITDRKQAELTIKHMAYHDSLTGLPNRDLFNKNLVQKINLANHNNQECFVMSLDLDGFKMVNDTLGHKMGDYLLKQAANRLSSCVRLGDKDMVARQGGDEFIIFLNEAKLKDTETVAKTILKTINYPFILGGKEIVITTSIGISRFPQDGINAETLKKNADTAMYRSKEIGKNNYCFFQTELDDINKNRLEMASSLRKAVGNEELYLVYQPKINLSLNRIVGVEALLRWNSPDFGMVSPAVFIPLAEETGIIVEIGEWVLSTAIKQNKKWQDKGFSPISISVNLSARQFLQTDLVQKVEIILQESELHPSHLILELTETMAMNNLEHSIEKLEQFKSLGIGLSLDDFGTGFSSLSYLKKFPINELKIDQSFIRDMIIDSQDASIVKAIISIAKSLNLTVVAEGVETEKHVNFLHQQQCDQAQGYYFSKPVPSSEIENILKESVTNEKKTV
ncbi:bifunctional diguanylate cyclase/phosphodiesterase [Peribacillus saganii]|uniref:Bifunctional diguanylate cyclase/phosphodiesterase n=1 Tax=Peribacillus saganii TaxID=2303992 RepID=A0A372LVQ5_9BACI|nr:bifunctional diguanylate cyclase/phosphodiesterase [Peribacillus saganii]RFU71644.1 bifunctional diguanylate cyclase/phosphodiesterase [Peribacillus saganii]